MKIVIITNNYPPVSDGVGDYSFFLTKELIEKQHHVSIICNNGVKSEKKEHQILPMVEKWDKRNCINVIKKIDSIRPDWVLLQYVPHGYNKSGMPFPLISLVKSIRKLNARLLINFHELWMRGDVRKPKSVIASLSQKCIAFVLCKYADAIITSIDSYAQLLSHLTNKEIKKLFIPPNFNTALLPEDNVVDALKQKIAGENKVVVVFGVRDPFKVLAIFEKSKELFPSLMLLVCGKNLFPEKAKQRKDIFFTGILDAEDLPAYIACGDVFLAADPVVKKAGGSSNKSGSIAAPLYLGVPVVGTRGDMNNEAMINSKNVSLEDSGSIDAIATRIVMFLKEERSGPKDNQWKPMLSWENTARQIITILHNK